MNDDCKCVQDLAFSSKSLQAPDVFPHPVKQLEIRETHISRIILTGEFAYKIKKPLNLGFMDASTLQRRRELCELELRLNRRLAPDLYLEVVAIVRDSAGRLRFGGTGDVIEYAVRMRQFDGSQELHNLLAHHEVTTPELLDLATAIAKFHQHADSAASHSEYGGAAQIQAVVLSNLKRLLEFTAEAALMPELKKLSDWTHDSVYQLAAVFEQRKQAGRVRECHGDLHTRNIVRWQDLLMPFDCLEFDPQLRWIDVINDVAFLVMDLIGHDRPDLAYAFLSRYLESSGDYDGVRLLSFYAVYRASVRAMVDALGARQMPAQHQSMLQRLRQRLHTALKFIDRPTSALLIMHGPSGSGKSWLSERLVSELPALRIRSDVERKRLAGIDPLAQNHEVFGKGIYSAEFTNRTYAYLLDCAEACLQGGISVIVDAAFLQAGERHLFDELAMRMRVPYLIISCMAEPAVLAQRIAMRQARRADPSDADQTVLAQQLQVMQPLSDEESRHAVQANTAKDDLQATVDRIRLRFVAISS